MTYNQLKLLKFIQSEMDSKGCSPTFREMADYMGVVSTSRVHASVDALEAHGFITRTKGCARGLEVTKRGLARIGLTPGLCPACGQSIRGERNEPANY